MFDPKVGNVLVGLGAGEYVVSPRRCFGALCTTGVVAGDLAPRVCLAAYIDELLCV